MGDDRDCIYLGAKQMISPCVVSFEGEKTWIYGNFKAINHKESIFVKHLIDLIALVPHSL